MSATRALCVTVRSSVRPPVWPPVYLPTYLSNYPLGGWWKALSRIALLHFTLHSSCTRSWIGIELRRTILSQMTAMTAVRQVGRLTPTDYNPTESALIPNTPTYVYNIQFSNCLMAVQWTSFCCNYSTGRTYRTLSCYNVPLWIIVFTSLSRSVRSLSRSKVFKWGWQANRQAGSYTDSPAANSILTACQPKFKTLKLVVTSVKTQSWNEEEPSSSETGICFSVADKRFSIRTILDSFLLWNLSSVPIG